VKLRTRPRMIVIPSLLAAVAAASVPAVAVSGGGYDPAKQG
jgi:hypothetical protein